MDSERVELEPHLAAAMDKLMEELWMSGSDDFNALMHFMISEKISGNLTLNVYFEEKYL